MTPRTIRRAAERKAAKLARKAEKTNNPGPDTSQPARSVPTESQINANRANAQLSTGPTSESGKAAVSQNRRIHGLNYNAATFKVLACEDQQDYDRLLAALIETHEPQDTSEQLLVISMAQHRWLLDRATRLQETCFDPQTGQITDQKLFALYHRYATTHERAFNTCLSLVLNNRIREQKREIGFESEKRKAELHPMQFTFVYRRENRAQFEEIMRQYKEEDEQRAKLAQKAA